MTLAQYDESFEKNWSEADLNQNSSQEDITKFRRGYATQKTKMITDIWGGGGGKVQQREKLQREDIRIIHSVVEETEEKGNLK